MEIFLFLPPKHGHPALTMDPDDGAAGASASLTFVSPTILQGGTNDDQLGPTGFIAHLASCGGPQGLPIFGPAHRAIQGGGFTDKGQVLAFCDCDIREWPREDARLLWGIEKRQRDLGLWYLYERTNTADHAMDGISIGLLPSGWSQIEMLSQTERRFPSWRKTAHITSPTNSVSGKKPNSVF